MNKIEDYIYIKNLIPKEICSYLINESEKENWQKHSWYFDPNKSFTSEDKEELSVSSCSSLAQDIINPFIKKALDEYQQKTIIGEEKIAQFYIQKYEFIRYNKYNVGTRMRKHIDHIKSIFTGEKKGIPVLSIVGILNDNYEGGEFYLRNNHIKTKMGDILIFPSNFMFPHEVKLVTKGTRYSFISWGY